MSRSPEGPDSDLLFDLPLDHSGTGFADAEPEEWNAASEAKGEEEGSGTEDQVGLDFAPEGAPEMGPRSPAEASLGVRFTAAALDLVVVVAVLGVALLALRILEIPLSRSSLAPLAVFLGSFSFLYAVVPLAFWGHTPGMAHQGIMSRSRSGDFLTIRQCVGRWAGWVLTIVSGGLAALMALSGVSIADLISGSRVYLRPTD